MPGNIIQLTPAQIASWPTPDPENPYQRRWMPAYAAVLFAAATLMVATRLWLRMVKKQAGGLGIDDCLLLCSWVCLAWFVGVVLHGTEVDMIGRHMWNVPVEKYEGIARTIWIAEFSFLLSACCVKVSVLLFYRRLAEGVMSLAYRRAVVVALTFTVVYTFAFILALLVTCTPTDAYWRAFNPTYTSKHSCTDTKINNLLAGIMSVISDIYSVALPCIITWRFTLSLHQKIAINLIFSLGLFVVAASSVRTYYFWQSTKHSDVSWYMYDVAVWSLLELCLGLMCISVPSLRVLCRNYINEPLAKFFRVAPASMDVHAHDPERLMECQSCDSTPSAKCSFGSQRSIFTPGSYEDSGLAKPEMCVPARDEPCTFFEALR